MMEEEWSRSGVRTVVCVENKGYEFDLELHKRYEVIPDPEGDEIGLVRIVDETGEDYLYPQGLFAFADAPEHPQAETLLVP